MKIKPGDKVILKKNGETAWVDRLTICGKTGARAASLIMDRESGTRHVVPLKQLRKT